MDDECMAAEFIPANRLHCTHRYEQDRPANQNRSKPQSLNRAVCQDNDDENTANDERQDRHCFDHQPPRNTKWVSVHHHLLQNI